MISRGGSRFSDVDAGFGDEAAQYLSVTAELARDSRRESYQLLNIGMGSSVLDVGCGLGEVCADLAQLVGAAGLVVGVDAATELIERARERWRDLPCRFEVGDAEALVFDDASFDAVRAERLLQHLDRPEVAVAEMARVVRAGGRVLVVDAIHDAATVSTDLPRTWEAIRSHGSGANRQPRAGLHLDEWMQAAGLTVETNVRAGLLRSWPTFRALYRIDEGVTGALEGEAVAADEVARFLAEQEDRDARGLFTAVVVGVVAVGTKVA